MKRLAAFVAAVVMVAPAAVEAQEIGSFSEVVLVGAEGTSFQIGTRTYSGDLRLRGLDDGISVVERVDIDGYLAGVREVPASWPDAALDAQAVAARTYLAWTLSRGRSTSARRYDFDICATTQCQVYAGTGAGEQPWVEAVARTAGEVLLYEGSPAQTMYFSTSGGYTEAIQDIFSGATPKPYLSGVDSPDEPSPLVTWSISMPARAFHDVLEAEGITTGDLVSLAVASKPKGEGVWDLEVVSSDGVVRIPVSRVRSMFNRHGPSLYPDLFPGDRPDGRPYPQTILSYRFDVVFSGHVPIDATLRSLPVDDRPVSGTVTFAGEGWGHHVGMSQFGALAMAEAGETYDSILGHYYGGLQPEAASGVVPDVVSVGLMWGSDNLVVSASGPFTIIADGRDIAVTEPGTWIFTAIGGDVAVVSGNLLVDRLLTRIGSSFPLL